jgi:GNAT superfamily N-acetyltransferase
VQLGEPEPGRTRRAESRDAADVAQLLHDFNTEFDVATPGPAVLAERLAGLLNGADTVAILSGDPAMGVALLTLRPNVWYDGPVALLDELYVVPHLRGRGIGSALLAAATDLVRSRGVELVEVNVDGDDVGARRFYESHGFRCQHGEPAELELYYSREI